MNKKAPLHGVVQEFRYAKPKQMTDGWWSYLENRVQDIGAMLRGTPPKKKVTVADEFLDFPGALEEDEADNLPF